MRKLAFVSVLCAGAIAAQAAVIWDQGPAGGTYAGSWSQTTDSQELVDSFMFTQDMLVTDYHFFSNFNPPGGNSWEIAIYADAGGSPGAELFEFSDTYDSYTFWGNQSGVDLYQATFTFAPILLSGNVKYWIGASGNGFESAVVSSFGSAQGDGFLAFRSNSTGSWNVINSIGDVTFQLTGEPVPEPASMIALGVGAIALLRRRNRK